MHSATNIQKARHFRFLRSVFWLGFTAFGGPQMHLPYFKKRFVDKLKFITQDELVEINAFCSILPGPSTTQTITSIGYKVGGTKIAILTILLWSIPGAIIMTLLGLSPKFLNAQELSFLPAMVIGFMAFGTWKMFQWIDQKPLNIVMFILAGILGFVFRNPWFFPIGVLLGGFISSRFNNTVRIKKKWKPREFKWVNLTIFASIFFIVGISGILITKYKTESKWKQPVVLFENTYRLGALSFGGGNVFAAMTMEQYVHHTKRMDIQDLNIGIAASQAVPGPNFNLAAYSNTVALRNQNSPKSIQILGGIIGLIGVFLPGTLLVLFAFPIWDRLQTFSAINRAVPGIFAVSVGFILTACLLLGNELWHTLKNTQFENIWIHLGLLTATFFMLISEKIPTPFIVLFAVAIGWFVSLN